MSYSWDNDNHKEKVLSFAEFLRKSGFNITLDEIEMQQETSGQFKEMMLKNLHESNKVIIVLSEGYKDKADNFTGGVGFEYKYIIEDIDKIKSKYILVSFCRLNNEVIEKITPSAFKGREIVDLDVGINDNYNKLFSKLTDTPLIELSPVADTKPVIKQKSIPLFESLSNDQQDSKDEGSSDIDSFSDTRAFFDYRMAKAFPGLRGLKWYNEPDEAIRRLEVLLRQPLQGKSLGMSDPIWNFRGSSNIDIDSFKIINNEKCLIGIEECVINRICAYRSSQYYRSFVYIELKPEEPIFDSDTEGIQMQLDYFGYASEEYALYSGYPVNRQEYDDGAAVINGKLVDFKGKSELRCRYLSKYNFIICAKFHPINCFQGDTISDYYFNSLLNNKCEIEEFIKAIEKLPKGNENNM